jgi:hypothetical protein
MSTLTPNGRGVVVDFVVQNAGTLAIHGFIHWHLMLAQKPLFTAVLPDGGEWLIEAEWPDGSIEHVCTFKAHADAAKWLKARSEAWLQERM